jgi:hypothetical protein
MERQRCPQAAPPQKFGEHVQTTPRGYPRRRGAGGKPLSFSPKCANISPRRFDPHPHPNRKSHFRFNVLGPMLGTGHSTRRVVKPNGDAPQRHMPPGPLSHFVVARCRPRALRAPSLHPLVGSHADFNSLRLAMSSVKPNVLKNKSGMGLNLVQNRFNVQLNDWSLRRRFLCCTHHRLTQTMETSFFSQPRFGRRPPCASFACRRRLLTL